MTAVTMLAQVDQTASTVQTPSIEWFALLPLIILAVGALVLLTVASLARGRLFRGFYALYTIAISGAAIIASLPVWARVQGWSEIWGITLTNPSGVGPFSTVGGAVGIDGFSIFVTVVICSAVIVGALAADGYLRRERLDGPEFYVLMLLSATGGVIMAMANDLIVLFLGLETLSIAVYVLTAMQLRRAESQEGGLKYFILGAFSSAFFLYGIALLYGATGSTNLITIKSFMAANIPIDNGLLLLGLALLLVGFGFKVAAMPFHAWSPDAYDGAPTPAVVYMAAGVKAAAFAGLVRVFMLTFSNYAADWQPIVYALAVLSMVGGALVAIVQTNVKRMMAYSSISHAGFILVAVEAASGRGIQAVLFYLAAYTFMIAGTFTVITVIGRTGDGRHQLTDYRGLARQPGPRPRADDLPARPGGRAVHVGVLRQVLRDHRVGRRGVVAVGVGGDGLGGHRGLPVFAAGGLDVHDGARGRGGCARHPRGRAYPDRRGRMDRYRRLPGGDPRRRHRARHRARPGRESHARAGAGGRCIDATAQQCRPRHRGRREHGRRLTWSD